MHRFAGGALERAKQAAFGPAEYAEQESFIQASELRTIALRVGIGPGTSVLDLCCGIAGPGRLLTREFGCTYLGVDASERAVVEARERAGNLPCRFVVSEIPPLPPGTFDVVLLLETILAFRDKGPLLRAVSRALSAGGRFAFTLEEGAPLTKAEQAKMPGAETVWLTPLEQLGRLLAGAGLALRCVEDWTESHRAVAESLTAAYTADARSIASRIGKRRLDELVAAHELWSEWLGSGRVRKFFLVADLAAGERPDFAD